MTCEEFEDRLGAYIDGELDAAARQGMEEHLRECPACRSSYARQRALSAALRKQLPTFEAPDLLRARVEGVLRGAHSEQVTTPTRRWRWAAIAASALFVVTAGYAVLATRDAVSPQDGAQERAQLVEEVEGHGHGERGPDEVAGRQERADDHANNDGVRTPVALTDGVRRCTSAHSRARRGRRIGPLLQPCEVPELGLI